MSSPRKGGEPMDAMMLMLMLMLQATIVACPYPHICNLMAVPMVAPHVPHGLGEESKVRPLAGMSGVPP